MQKLDFTEWDLRRLIIDPKIVPFPHETNKSLYLLPTCKNLERNNNLVPSNEMNIYLFPNISSLFKLGDFHKVYHFGRCLFGWTAKI